MKNGLKLTCNSKRSGGWAAPSERMAGWFVGKVGKQFEYLFSSWRRQVFQPVVLWLVGLTSELSAYLRTFQITALAVMAESAWVGS